MKLYILNPKYTDGGSEPKYVEVLLADSSTIKQDGNGSSALMDNGNYVKVLTCTAGNAEFTPTEDYQPATKKYCDDTLAAITAKVEELEALIGQVNQVADRILPISE